MCVAYHAFPQMTGEKDTALERVIGCEGRRGAASGGEEKHRKAFNHSWSAPVFQNEAGSRVGWNEKAWMIGGLFQGNHR